MTLVTKAECRRMIWGALGSLLSASGIDDIFGYELIDDWSEEDQEKFRNAWKEVQAIIWTKSRGSGR